jgi:DNA-binding NarL/FixJ family response regulator
LTSREEDVLALLARGMSSKAIAQRLKLSPFTVRTHRQNLMNKFGAHSVIELLMLAKG